MSMKATALAHPNIAFIKYWGLKDEAQRIPANDSISMNIGCLSTRTTVEYDFSLKEDTLTLNGQNVTGPALQRVGRFMDRVRQTTCFTMPTSKVKITSPSAQVSLPPHPPLPPWPWLGQLH